jgi:glycosyltransferase involved in cell wall biosynthesis
MQNKKIIHVAQYGAPYKGAFISALENLEHILEFNYSCSVVYVFPQRAEERVWMADFKKNRIVYFIKNKSDIRIKTYKQLKRIFQLELPDIIHTHFDGYDEIAILANQNKAKVIWHLHNSLSYRSDFLRRFKQKFIFFRHYKLFSGHVHAIAVSEWIKNFVINAGFRRENMIVLPNGIDEQRIHPKNLYYYNTIRPYSFLALSGRHHIKGIDILLEACEKLNKERMDFQLYLTNGRDTEEQILKKYDILPSWLHIIEQNENINEILSVADCFISSSRFETFSFVIAEAVLANMPVISSNIEGVTWAKQLPCCFFFESENPDSLCAVMHSLAKDEDKTIFDKCVQSRQIVVDNYSINSWANKIITIYDKTLSK